MEAGRELDAVIAEKVLGYTLDYEFADINFQSAPCVKELRDQYDEWGLLPHYSIDIGDAWAIVNKLCTEGMFFDLGTKSSDGDNRHGPLVWNAFIDRTIVGPDAPSAALAICLAALKARGITAENCHARDK